MADIDPNTPILFLNTGKLFGETLRYRDRLQDVLGLGDVRSLAPSLEDRDRFDPEGTLWSRNADACCDFRKTVPLNRALEPFQAQITGRKRFQTRERANMQPVEFFQGRYRFNPLWQWDLHQLEAFTERHKLPQHPLVEDGYPSIGCMPCTRRVQAGEDYRAGRWSGLDKDECGIHLDRRRRYLTLRLSRISSRMGTTDPASSSAISRLNSLSCRACAGSGGCRRRTPSRSWWRRGLRQY